MHPFLKPLVENYQKNANPENAYWASKYLKNQFPFLGIKSPQRTIINKEFFSQYGQPDFNDIEIITDDLLQMPEREFQYFAITLTDKMKKQWNEDTWKLFEKMILTKSWWDTVDAIAANNLGMFFRKFPGEKETITYRWNQSDNMWLIRSSILFQLKYKKDTDAELLFSYIFPHLGSKEFFIQKAIGWALRQYARTNPQEVLQFANAHELAPLSRREALKHLNN